MNDRRLCPCRRRLNEWEVVVEGLVVRVEVLHWARELVFSQKDCEKTQFRLKIHTKFIKLCQTLSLLAEDNGRHNVFLCDNLAGATAFAITVIPYVGHNYVIRTLLSK